MKKKSLKLLCYAFMILSFIGITALASNEQKQPKLILSTVIWNFGKVREGQLLTHTFTIYNAGDMALIIDSVTPTCDCTTVNHSTLIIPAGGNVQLKITLNTSENSGNFKNYIMISSNDPEQPVKRFEIIGEIVRKLPK